MEAIFRNPALYELGALIPRPPRTAGGARRMYPDYMPLAFDALASVWKSTRQVEAELSSPLIWNHIRKIVLELFPHRPEMHLPDRPMERHHFTYARNTYLAHPKVQACMQELHRKLAVAQAEAIGLLNARGPGSLTHPHPSRVMFGDGKVVTPLTKHEPGDTYVDKSTGKVRSRRIEPDAALHYEGGNKDPIRGTKFVVAAVRGRERHARMILDIAWVPKPGGEAEVALECFRRLARLAKGAQGVVYDGELRGKHNQELLQLGLIPIDRVAARRRGFATPKGRVPRVPKDVHVEDRSVRLKDGTLKTLRIHAKDGTIGLSEVTDKGDMVFIPLKRVKVDSKPNKRGGFRWYATFRLPEPYGGGGTVTIRMDQTPADERRGFNRTENVRIIPHSDEDFDTLYRLRPDAESINRGIEDSLYWNRAHSLGHARQQVDMLGYALMVNSLAIHLAQRRAPPDMLAA